MTDMIMNTTSLPEILFKLITAEKVRVKESGGVIQLVPVIENTDCTIGLRGMFAGDPNMTVDKQLISSWRGNVLIRSLIYDSLCT